MIFISGNINLIGKKRGGLWWAALKGKCYWHDHDTNSDLMKCQKFERQAVTLTANQFYTDPDSRLIAFLPSGSQILTIIPILNGATINLSGVLVAHNSDGSCISITNNGNGQTVYYDVTYLYK